MSPRNSAFNTILNYSTVYLPFSVIVRCGDHLRKVNHGYVPLVIDHQVELVEVAVDHSTVSEPHYQLHTVVVDLRWISHTLHIAPETKFSLFA